MTVEVVLDALLFWSNQGGIKTWTIDDLYLDDSDGPWPVNDEAKLRQQIRDLYVNSPTMRTMLDQMALTGPIRIAQTRPNWSPAVTVTVH